ncbi:MAG: hypothetical protein Q7R48_03170 [bacterium]|nr:hypothetical protein [bacterium]
MEETIKNILKLAINAPSGHNYQPWRFRIQGSALSLFNLPERDTTIYNFLQRGSYMAHGALIENILVAASHFQYKGIVSLFPKEEGHNCTATIVFEPSPELKEDTLFASLAQRTTNRKPYKNIPLEPAHREEIMRISGELAGGAMLRLVEDAAKKKALAGAFSCNERLALENHAVHQSLFPHVIWSEKEEAEKRSGLYIKTFELPPPAQIAFRMFRNWTLVKVIGKRVSQSIAKQNAGVYAAASAIGLIAIPNDSDASFVLAGRLLEKIWLTATRLQLSFQPVTAVVYLGQRIIAGERGQFSKDQAQLIESSYNTVKHEFNISAETMAMTFRIGYDGNPSAYSSKLPPRIELA